MKSLADLPNELVDQILRFVPKKRLSVLARVSKRIYPIAKSRILKSIHFESLTERNLFFETLSKSFYERKSKNAGLIQALDFGLRPRVMLPNEPPLPCSKPISPNRMALDSPRITTINTSRWNLGGSPDRMAISPTRTSLRISTRSTSSTSPTRVSKTTRSPTRTSPSRMSTSPSAKSPTKVKSTMTERYGEWNHRFISQYIPHITTHLPHLKSLNLCGCHLNAHDFMTILTHLKQLRHLDISYSTLKSDGVSSIARYARNLETLDMSGIFKFGRNRTSCLVDIVLNCGDLEKLVLKDCPEVYPETVEEIQSLNSGVKLIMQ
jgi:hypothetical protein